MQKIFPRFVSKNVIVIGAGPSLEQNIAVLRKCQADRSIVLVATDMSLRLLVRQGIYPSFVFSCETLPVNFFSGIDTSKMHLVAFTCMSHSNLRQWAGGMSFYNWMLSENGYRELWDYAGSDLGFVATASIITTQAVAFVLGAGVKSVLLVGNDLGFSDRFYARGTSLLEFKGSSATRFKTIESFDMDLVRKKRDYQITRGNRIFYTNHQFLAAKMWLEDLFTRVEVPVYDCSTPGCSEKSVRKVIIQDYCVKSPKNISGEYLYDSIT